MGTIRVRCALSHHCLWFHLDMPFAEDHLHPDFRNDGKDRKLNELLRREQPWDKLTPVGRKITQETLKFRGIMWLSARPDYFDLAVNKEKRWRKLLPGVVAIIRKATNDPKARVVPYVRPNSTKVPQWHVPLLEELFG